MAKSQRKALADQLHAQGVRKRVARALAEAAEAPKGARTASQRAAGEALQQLRDLTEQLEDRLGTPAAERRKAAQKGAKTRAAATAKRSAAAKQGARTRSSSSRSSSSRAKSTGSRSAGSRSSSGSSRGSGSRRSSS
ncbi:MAG TPA: hypothetical protein VGI54_12080 [Solirubrobacteraceae bacterium]